MSWNDRVRNEDIRKQIAKEDTIVVGYVVRMSDNRLIKAHNICEDRSKAPKRWPM